ncbi:uncharacterized protein LOC125494130 [Beta vulgaris subsp. vulgaris]|uniref:uncharacterized protein LOC125494130 n=1 Tax=Beta vulgaris subsp. vulgaris TaxID=3555 RepID=UPI002036ACB8|nr:uncharacterized protein LOC125494130 [Beta vulgaris subsp. vulgaris]
MCDTLVRWSEMDATVVQKGCYILWNVWVERNRKVFEFTSHPATVVGQRIMRQVVEFNNYAVRIYGGVRSPAATSSSRWSAPPFGAIKLNTDASLAEEGWVGLGVIARDSEGKVCFAATRRVRAYWPPEVAECKAIYMATRLAKDHGYGDVIFESDSLVATKRLSKAAIFFSDLDAILGDILAMCNAFSSVSFSHVKRDGNTVAHNLARVVPFGVEQCWEHHCPSIVTPYILMDTLSL